MNSTEHPAAHFASHPPPPAPVIRTPAQRQALAARIAEAVRDAAQRAWVLRRVYDATTDGDRTLADLTAWADDHTTHEAKFERVPGTKKWQLYTRPTAQDHAEQFGGA